MKITTTFVASCLAFAATLPTAARAEEPRDIAFKARLIKLSGATAE
jgi:hypothetical protein